jgi:hypothetical protein
MLLQILLRHWWLSQKECYDYYELSREYIFTLFYSTSFIKVRTIHNLARKIVYMHFYLSGHITMYEQTCLEFRGMMHSEKINTASEMSFIQSCYLCY